MPTLEERFHEAMIEIYKRAKREIKYNARVFLSMVIDHGGLGAAQRLLHAPVISDGYTTLYLNKRLDLSMEMLVLQPEWHDLFTLAERQIALDRLRQYQYTGPLPDVA